MMTNDKMIYVHIPFCDSKCFYCDFISGKYNESVKNQYVNALQTEIINNRNDIQPISSIFIGGGTPSSIKKEYIKQIIECVKQNFKVLPDVEITIETNPCSVTLEKLIYYVNCGINRISFGVQSLDNNLLNVIGRRHNKDQALEAVSLAKRAGFLNINCDVLIGIPGQTYEQLLNTVETLIKTGITHISCYMLINEPNTVLTNKIEAGEVNQVDDDLCVQWYNDINLFLKQNGFLRYEVSNFCKQGFECKHNCGYWNMKKYYGFGVAAHSYIDNIRKANTTNLNKYIAGDYCANQEKLTSNEIIEEKLLLGLRLVEGVSVSELKELGYDILSAKKQEIELLKKQGVVEVDNNIKITTNYFGVGDDITLKLLP